MVPFLRLMRPANIVTALADILAGAAVARAWSVGAEVPAELGLLLLSTVGLYGGGVVFNDVFDVELDREERPERPLPSGQISLSAATFGGALLLLGGIMAACGVSWLAGGLALIVAVLALGYDKYGKHHPFFGPLMMGMCRGGNLLIGMSIVSATVADYWFIALIPIVFIAAITVTSRGEVDGGNRRAILLAIFLDVVVVAGILALTTYTDFSLTSAWPFLLLWILINARGKVKALLDNQPATIMGAVKLGVLSLIPLNATLTAGFLGWQSGLVVLALLPVSLGLARYFAVT